MMDLTEVTFVKRIVVGSENPERLRRPEEVDEALRLVNRCLSDVPKGRIIGIERTFSLLNINGHQVVLECVIYHIGFMRRPAWLD